MTMKQDIEKVLEDVKDKVDESAQSILQEAAALGAKVAQKVEDVAGDVKDGASKVEQKAADIKVELENVANGIIVT